MLMDAIVATHSVGKHVGIHGLVVRALNHDRVPFYEGLGFRSIGANCSSPTMLLPIDSIRELIEVEGEP